MPERDADVPKGKRMEFRVGTAQSIRLPATCYDVTSVALR
jgi:hypothetical protein